MNRARWVILLVGPWPILAGSVALSRWAKPERAEPPAVNRVMARGATESESHRLADVAEAANDRGELTRACRLTADHWRARLGEECHVIVRTPFVIAGDLTREQLDDWHGKTIGPAARAMSATYFKTAPDRPVTVLLFSQEQSYNHYCRELFDDEGISVYGYYKPIQRTVVTNIGTGGGTLVHELTHALMDFDFAAVPDWFNEGLASLHEQCRIRPDESGIDGLENWRLAGLQETIRRQRLRSLADLIAANDFRGAEVGLNYAHARYFCLYLQRRGLLTKFFREFRASQQDDSLGLKTAQQLFGGKAWKEIDADFQSWVLELRHDG